MSTLSLVGLPISISPSLMTSLGADLTSSTGTTASVIAPHTGAELWQIPQSSAADVTAAIASARLAQVAWSQAGNAHRRRVLLKAHDLLLEREDLILDLVQAETGKTRGQAFEEVFAAASSTRYYALTARRVLKTRSRRAAFPIVYGASVEYHAKGVIGVITPWNYPLSLAMFEVAPALAAGNAVVQKTDNQASLNVLAIRRAFIEAGVPEELWAVVAGPGPEIGTAMIAGVDHISFTGSTATGVTIAKQAAGRLIGASLELGGKNPMIVLDDVDVAKAARNAAYSAFAASGQLCVSIERIYVQDGIFDEFSREFARVTSAMKQGSAFDFTSDIGTLVSAAQLERVEAHVADAVKKGATVLAGGAARPDLGPYFYAPTVLTGVTAKMQCFAGETFGPVVSLYRFGSVDEAISDANDSEYGLNASVFSGSLARAREVASRLQAGSVNLNEGFRGSFGAIDAPMGGVKRSGLGRRNGPEGILRFVDSTTIGTNRGLMQIPLTGDEAGKLHGFIMTLLKTLKAVRRA